jgi:hypothetical protein
MNPIEISITGGEEEEESIKTSHCESCQMGITASTQMMNSLSP